MKICPSCSYHNPDSQTDCLKCQAALDLAPVQAQASIDTGSASNADSIRQDTCPVCGLSPESNKYAMPLCAACRTKMAGRPFPSWVVASSIFVLLVLVWAFVKFPGAINAGVAFERGQRAENAGNYAVAMAQYKIATQRYADSTLALSRLAICQCKSGDLRGAEITLSILDGREASAELVDEIDKAIAEADRKFGGK